MIGRRVTYPKRSAGLVCTAATVALGVAAQAQPAAQAVATPVVPGYEHLRLAGAGGDVALGEVLLGELNCLSCHEPAPELSGRLLARAAPDLAALNERVTVEWLTAYLASPATEKPGTAMPEVLHSLEAADRDRTARSLARYLFFEKEEPAVAVRGSADVSEEFPVFRFRATVERGRRLFHSIGCVACHAPEAPGAEPAIPSVPLPDLAAKTSVAALTRLLLEPRSVRPSGRMPSLYLTPGEAEDLAIYLLRDQEPQVVERRGGFEFEYYLDPMQDEDAKGFFNRPPLDLDTIEPAAEGRIGRLSLRLPVEMNYGNHAFRFTGLMSVPETGRYTLSLASDRRSGSSLAVDGELVATKPGGSARETDAELQLEAGDHPVTVTYFIRGDTQEPFLTVGLVGDALPEGAALEDYTTYENVRLRPGGGTLVSAEAEEAGWGARLFVRHGCASCHGYAGIQPDRRDVTTPPALTDLDPAAVERGAAMHTGAYSPRYRLADPQKRAIRAALQALPELAASRTPADQIVHTMASYNCYACHRREAGTAAVGGPDSVRASHFAVVGGQDLGDEGRLPPPLDGAGGKLKPEALRSILGSDELHVRRDYMEVRMPSFAGATIEQLSDALTTVDATAGDLHEPAFSTEAASDGIELLGEPSMSCITCHNVHVHPALGVSTIDLATAYDRLRPGWVARFLRDPAAIRPGTRMPSFWPEGVVNFQHLGGGSMDGQIDAIWSALSLGTSMPAPEGANIGSELVLVPNDRPLVFRTHMIDVGPRSIAIGYPENVHVAFDANNIRLAKVWRGGFFDARGTWQGRAGQFFGPYGTDVLNLPPGPAIASLDDIDSPWPIAGRNDRNVGGRFLGYRLDDEGRPVLRYRLHDLLIEEAPEPLRSGGGTDLIRRFRLAAGSDPRPLYLLLAEGDEIASESERSWSVDGQLDVSIASEADLAPFVRESQGVRQLLQRIDLAPGETLQLDVTLSW